MGNDGQLGSGGAGGGLVERQALYDLVWSEPLYKLGPKFGMSGRGLAKLCARYDIPVPPRGYWNKLEAGHKVTRPKLPPTRGARSNEVHFSEREPKSESKPMDPELAAILKRLQAKYPRKPSAENSDELLPISARTLKSILASKPDSNGLVRPRAKSVLDIAVSHELAERAVLAMDRVLRELKRRGIKWDSGTEPRRETYCEIDGREIHFQVQEMLKRSDRALTRDEKRRIALERHTYISHRYSYAPRGLLRLRITSNVHWGTRYEWKDGKRIRLEECAEKIVDGLLLAVATDEKWERDREREQAEWEENRQREREAEQRRQEEKRRREELIDEVRRWELACSLRRYRQAVLDACARHDQNHDDHEWVRYLERVAASIDPLPGRVRRFRDDEPGDDE